MPRILVNGVEERADCACNSWGELLEYLDGAVAGVGQVLTGVRFEGVEQPTFRDPSCGPLPVAGLSLVEVESARPQDLLRNSVHEAVAAARTLASGAERVGGAFRGFDVSSANQDLVEMAQGLGTLVAIVQALSQALGVGLDCVRVGGHSGSEMIEELTTQADTLISAQREGDWITVADVIEYDLAPALQQWPALFEALGTSIPN